MNANRLRGWSLSKQRSRCETSASTLVGALGPNLQVAALGKALGTHFARKGRQITQLNRRLLPRTSQ